MFAEENQVKHRKTGKGKSVNDFDSTCKRWENITSTKERQIKIETEFENRKQMKNLSRNTSFHRLPQAEMSLIAKCFLI